jgi:hypothetical protein
MEFPPTSIILSLEEQVQFAVPGLQDGPSDPGWPAGDTAAPAGPSGEKRNWRNQGRKQSQIYGLKSFSAKSSA